MIPLDYYSRKDIQEAMLKSAKNREIATKFGDKGFGKRPDTLEFEGDILELAKQGATSFHCSEELWHDVYELKTGLTKKQLNSLRQGWDLLIDVDCKSWGYSKLVANYIVKALQYHKIKAVSVKFSGNRGWHIAVPFNAFPKRLGSREVKDIFPDAARSIVSYLVSFIEEQFSKDILTDESLVGIAKKSNMPKESFVKVVCQKCSKPMEDAVKIKTRFACPYCSETQELPDGKLVKCSFCSRLFKRSEIESELTCSCGSRKFIERFNFASLIDIDTILVSSRHLFRMPYSLHEKSGLVSLPINPESIMEFEKEYAAPEKVKVSCFNFLDDDVDEQASSLLMESLDRNLSLGEKVVEKKIDFKPLEGAVSEQNFPPCMQKSLEAGLTDGRKRTLFILINFLRSLNWQWPDIENRVKIWNSKNEEPLQEGYINSQISWHKKQGKKFLPPNCDNESYYLSLGTCMPDSLCKTIKNPVNYAIKKSRAKS